MDTETTVEEPGGLPRPPDDALRGQLHRMWAAVAGSWGTHAEYVDTRAAAATDKLLEAVGLRRGDRVLELACGPGGLALSAAERLAGTGEVVASDVVAEMTAIAAARAQALGLTNVRTCELDLEEIDQPDRSYDIVLCREGLMFVLDPARAAGEIVRVLRPGGRVGLAVWGARDRNPWLGLVLDALSAEMGAPVPPPGIPGPFALDDPVKVAGLLSTAGLADVTVTELPTPLHAGAFEKWWTRTSSLAGPLTTILASLPEGARLSLRARLAESVAPFQTPAGLEFPGVNLLATGRRP